MAFKGDFKTVMVWLEPLLVRNTPWYKCVGFQNIK